MITIIVWLGEALIIFILGMMLVLCTLITAVMLGFGASEVRKNHAAEQARAEVLARRQR